MSKEKIVARPYAKAVFELARETNTLDAWSAMLSLAARVVEDAKFSTILKNPRVSSSWLVETMVAVDPKAFSKDGLSFLDLIGSTKRWPILPAVSEFFEAYKAKALDVCPVHITVAYALTEAQRDSLSVALSRHVGKQLALTYETDAHILGGAVIRIGDQLIDGSVRGRLLGLADVLGVAV